MGSYIEQVETLFLSTVRKGLCLRAADLETVRDWDRRGVPLNIVSRGLLNGIRAFLASAEPSTPVPSSLRYYRTAVEREFEIYNRAVARGLGTDDRDAPKRTGDESREAGRTSSTGPSEYGRARPVTLADRALAVLQTGLADAVDVRKAAWQRAIEFFESCRTSVPLADLLFQVEDMLVMAIGETLPPQEFAAIREAVEGRLKDAEARGLGRKAIDDLRRNGLRKAVAEHTGFTGFIDAVLKDPKGRRG